jgi:hypothetical protein
MELALACRLRAYHAVPDSALRQLVRHRTRLRRLFRQAYEQRLSGLGAPIKIKSDRYGSVYLRGVFLDLRINFSGGRLISFGPPTLLSPPQAMAVYAYSDLTARVLLPINISFLSEELVNKSLLAPVIRRGPHFYSAGVYAKAVWTTWPKTVTRSASPPSMRRLASHLIAHYGSVPSRLIRLAGGKGWDFDIGPGRYRRPEGHGSSPKDLLHAASCSTFSTLKLRTSTTSNNALMRRCCIRGLGPVTLVGQGKARSGRTWDRSLGGPAIMPALLVRQ